MRYKAIVKNYEGPGFVTFDTDECIVTLRGKQLVDPDVHPYPNCLFPEKNLLPKGYHCYKTPDGIVFDDYGASAVNFSGVYDIDFWYYVPETHVMFNIDILYSLFEHLEPGSNNKARLKLAHRVASTYIKRSVKKAKVIKKRK